MTFYENHCSDLKILRCCATHGFSMPIYHIHPHWELYFCADPIRQTTFVNGQTITYQQPLAILCPPFSHHGTSVDPNAAPFIKDVFFFGQDFLSTMPEQYFSLAPFSQSAACFFPLQPLDADELFDLAGQVRRTDAAGQHLLFAYFFHQLQRAVPASERLYIGQANSYIQDVMRYIVNNLAKPLSVPAIAEQFYISPNKLSKDFKQFTTTTPHQFIINLRLNHAKDLLRKSNPPSNREIAHRCGFENEYYFYIFFKKQTGMAPKEFAHRKKS